MTDEWKNGFQAGMNWCRELSQKPDGFETEFWPAQSGIFRNGYAEGTITGRGEYNVQWRGVRVTSDNWIVAKESKKLL